MSAADLDRMMADGKTEADALRSDIGLAIRDHQGVSQSL